MIFVKKTRRACTKIIRRKLHPPKKITRYNLETKYFFRFYVAIHAHPDQRPEPAYREIENLRHLTSGKEEMSIHPVVNFFHRYFYTISHHPFHDETYHKNLEHLTADVQTFAATASPTMRSYLPFTWLRNQLTKPLNLK